MKNIRIFICAMVLTLLAFTGTFAKTDTPPGEPAFVQSIQNVLSSETAGFRLVNSVQAVSPESAVEIATTNRFENKTAGSAAHNTADPMKNRRIIRRE